MQHIAQFIFFINLAWLMTHELDAIQHHEWRILPLTSWMNEEWGYRIFVMAHIPLLAGLMAMSRVHEFQIAFDMFLVIHAGLHWLFRDHPQNTFNNRLSSVLIVGVIPLAIGHFALILMI